MRRWSNLKYKRVDTAILGTQKIKWWIICGKRESFFITFVGITESLSATELLITIIIDSYHQSFHTGNAATGRYSIKVATKLSSQGWVHPDLQAQTRKNFDPAGNRTRGLRRASRVWYSEVAPNYHKRVDTVSEILST
jgi:hypothetical protein